jgi:hypothetical protein
MEQQPKSPPNTSQIDIESSIKDFPNVLSRVPTGIEYNIGDLEFEFDLKWKYLKPLLNKHCVYKENNGKIKITRKKTQKDLENEEFKKKREKEREEDREKDKKREETRKKLKAILPKTFYKTREYRSMPKQDWLEEHIGLLEECIKLGIIQVWTHHGQNPMLVLEGHTPSYNNKMRY